MRVNEWALINFSEGECTMEGRLHHKRFGGNLTQGFKERWFKLKCNILFYFNLNDTGQVVDTKPAGAFVLENCTVAYEPSADVAFAFSLTFHDELEKKHLFGGPSEEKVNMWVSALKGASYELLRSHLLLLQVQLSSATGKDPLLIYPCGERSRPPVQHQRHLAKTKGPKKTSFRSYIDSTPEQSKPDQKKPPSILDDSGLLFLDDHFGNGLEAIGSKRDGADVNGAVKPSALRPNKMEGGSRFYDSVVSPNMPVRVAPPPPPIRPPRSNRQPTANLIDL